MCLEHGWLGKVGMQIFTNPSWSSCEPPCGYTSSVPSGSDTSVGCAWNTNCYIWDSKTWMSQTGMVWNMLLMSCRTTIVVRSGLGYSTIQNDPLFFSQWVAPESRGPITHATYSCDSQSIYVSFEDGSISILTASNLRLRCRISPNAYLPPNPRFVLLLFS